MVVGLGELVTGLLTSALESVLEDCYKKWKDNRKIDSFLQKIENWCNEYITHHETTILSSPAFSEYLQNYSVLDHMVEFVNGIESGKKENFLQKEFSIAKNAVNISLSANDESDIKAFLTSLFETVDNLFCEKVPLESRALLSRENRVLAGIDRIEENIYELNRKLDRTSTLQPEQATTSITKIQYSFEELYIPRRLAPFKDIYEGIWALPGRSESNLFDLCISKGHVVLLGEAGCGKSVELQHLAASISNLECDWYPFRYDLRDYVDEEIFDLIAPDYRSVDFNQLFLIFDAFDEIEPERQNAFARKINSFAKHYPKAIVLISCRNNFYSFAGQETDGGTFDTFAEYGLCPFSTQEIRNCAQKNGLDPDEFVEALNNHALLHMATIPFYLLEFLSIAKESMCFPSRSEIMDRCIRKRFQIDRMKYVNTEHLEQQKVQLHDLLRKIAFAMECMHLTSLDNEKYQRLFNLQERKLLNFSGVFNQNFAFEWQFDHNNFREYLAADYLNRLNDLEQVKRIICLSNGKIKESWMNTLSFLILMSEGESLQKWLCESDPEMVVKFERSRVSENTRNEIFIQIFDDLESKGLWLSFCKNNAYELAQFGQSLNTLNYLLSKIKANKNFRVTSNAICILSEFTCLYGRKKDVRLILFEHIKNTGTDDFQMSNVINAIVKLGLGTDEITSYLLDEYNPEERSSFCYAVLNYLIEMRLHEVHLDLFLKEDARGFHSGEVDSMGLRFCVEKAFQQLEEFESLCRVLRHFSKNHTSFSSVDKRLFAIIVEQLEKFYLKGHEAAFDEVYSVLAANLYTANRNQRLVCHNFFEKTGTVLKAFDRAIDEYLKDDRNSLLLIESFQDEKCYQHFLNRYKNNPKKWGELCKLLTVRMEKTSYAYAQMKQALHDNGIEIQVEEPLDYEKCRLDGNQQFFDSLFCKNVFLKLLDDLITFIGDPEITYDALGDKIVYHELRKSGEFALLFTSYSIDQLKIKDMRVAKFKETVKNWDWFSIINIYKTLKNGEKIHVSAEQQKYIQDFCFKNLDLIDFHVKRTVKDPNSCSFSYLLLCVSFFSAQFDIEYDKSIYQKMLLSAPCFFYTPEEHSGFSQYLTRRLGNRLKVAIIDNLLELDCYSDCADTYLSYCKENRIEDAIDLANSICSVEGFLTCRKQVAIDYLYEICGYEYVYDRYLNTQDEELLNQIVCATKQHKDKRLIERIEEENKKSDNGLKFLLDLIVLGSHYGVRRYIDLCRTKMSIPDYTDDNTISQITEAISGLQAVDFLDELSEMRKLVYTPGFRDKNSFGLSNSIYRAYQNVQQGEFEPVQRRLTDAIQEEQMCDEEKSFCNAILRDLQEACNRMNDRSWSIEEVLLFWKQNNGMRL